MDKNILEKNIAKIHSYYKEESSKLFSLQKWIDTDWKEQDFLNYMIDYIWINEKTKESRYAVYSRYVNLKEERLKTFLKLNNYSEESISNILDKSFIFVSDNYHLLNENLIKYIENNNLLWDFFITIMKWVHNVWKKMTKLHIVWDKYLIKWINKHLEERFKDSTEIINYLRSNWLFDKWHNNEEADRCYTVLKIQWDNYDVLSYYYAFKNEVIDIINELNNFISSIRVLNDDIYWSKNFYIDYLLKLKEAFSETDRDLLVEKWALVDKAWMDIKTPFQIWHPLEFYEDSYRKAVAIEWDLRLQDFNIMESNVPSHIQNMYELFYDDIWREKYIDAYKHSLNSFSNVQLYISSPIMFYASTFNGLFSAQVVPNDEEVSKIFGKKIFANASHILDHKRSTPMTQLKLEIFNRELLKKYDDYVHWDDKIFYSVYDITTIWHEYWHTLWLDMDTEVIMNKKTWNYKNIEEFKATTWWIVAYLLKDKQEYREEFLLSHVKRSISVIARQEVEEALPYYCECMIHLKILFDTWVIYFDSDNKINIDFSDKVFNNFREKYISVYKELIYTYLNKIDAWEFLFKFVKKNWKIFLPLDDKIKDFVISYYEKNKILWSQIVKDY